MANKSDRRRQQATKTRAQKQAAMLAPGGASRYARRRNGEPAADQGTPPKAVCGECYRRPCGCHALRRPAVDLPAPSAREALL